MGRIKRQTNCGWCNLEGAVGSPLKSNSKSTCPDNKLVGSVKASCRTGVADSMPITLDQHGRYPRGVGRSMRAGRAAVGSQTRLTCRSNRSRV